MSSDHFFAGDGTFGVKSTSLMKFISCLCGGVDSFDVSVEQLPLVCWCFYSLLRDFVSLASVLVVFSQWVHSSHLVAQSFSLQEIATRDSLVSCH